MTSSGVIFTESMSVPAASPIRAMTRFVTHAFRLRGRASPSEYWWWMLVNIVVVGLAQLFLPWLISRATPQPILRVGPFGSWFGANIELFTTRMTDPPSSPIAASFLLLGALWMVATLVPGFTVAVRRLHDSNLSGWWTLLALIPIGTLVLLALAIRPSRAEGARFDGVYSSVPPPPARSAVPATVVVCAVAVVIVLMLVARPSV